MVGYQPASICTLKNLGHNTPSSAASPWKGKHPVWHAGVQTWTHTLNTCQQQTSATRTPPGAAVSLCMLPGQLHTATGQLVMQRNTMCMYPRKTGKRTPTARGTHRDTQTCTANQAGPWQTESIKALWSTYGHFSRSCQQCSYVWDCCLVKIEAFFAEGLQCDTAAVLTRSCSCG